jgi:hypothetical protein
MNEGRNVSESTTNDAPTTTAPKGAQATSLLPNEARMQSRKGSLLQVAARSLRGVLGGVVHLAGAGFRWITARGEAGTPSGDGATRDVVLPPQDTATAAGSQLHQPGEGVFPIPRYDELSAGDAVTAVRTLSDLAHVQAVSRHERNNKARSTVISAIEERVADLSARA